MILVDRNIHKWISGVQNHMVLHTSKPMLTLSSGSSGNSGGKDSLSTVDGIQSTLGWPGWYLFWTHNSLIPSFIPFLFHL